MADWSGGGGYGALTQWDRAIRPEGRRPRGRNNGGRQARRLPGPRLPVPSRANPPRTPFMDQVPAWVQGLVLRPSTGRNRRPLLVALLRQWLRTPTEHFEPSPMTPRPTSKGRNQ